MARSHRATYGAAPPRSVSIDLRQLSQIEEDREALRRNVGAGAPSTELDAVVPRRSRELFQLRENLAVPLSSAEPKPPRADLVVQALAVPLSSAEPKPPRADLV